MNTKEAIENLYSVFSKYTTSNMEYCDCGCIDAENVKKLASKKLRALNEDDFSSYHGSALYTWGEVEHYKHFLPRILEVYNEKNGNGLVELYEITVKLEYAKWETWDKSETSAIKDFVMADWNDLVNQKASEIEAQDFEAYSFFWPTQDLMKAWEVTSTENSLRNFVRFFYSQGTELVHKGLKHKDRAITEIINQKGLLESLEKAFFEADEIDKEYAEKVSIVMQVIEQAKMLHNLDS